MFVVASASFRLLYVMIILAHDRRRIIHTAVTEHPTAAWLSRQVTEAFPWDTAPRYLLSSYLDYYYRSRTHLSLDQDCPDPRPIQRRGSGKVVALPQVAGLHHRYERLAA
jgi:hypothetical protein